jgi:hypothetical protein
MSFDGFLTLCYSICDSYIRNIICKIILMQNETQCMYTKHCFRGLTKMLDKIITTVFDKALD